MVFLSLRSAAIAALIVAADIALLTLFLNPALSPTAELRPLLLAIGLPYAVVAFVGFSVLALLLGAIRGTRALPRPLIEAMPWLSTLSFIATCICAGLYVLNLVYHRFSLPVASVRGLLTASAALVVSAAALLAVIVDSWFFASHKRGGAAALVVLAAGTAVVAPLSLVPVVVDEPAPPTMVAGPIHPLRRITFVGLDGVGPETLRDAVARGHAGALGRLMREGAFSPLATVRPTEGPPVWASVWTGRLPREHGVKSARRYRVRGSSATWDLLPKGIFASRLERAGLVQARPVESDSRRSKAVWNVLDAFEVPAGIVRFWGTHPPEPIKGFMLSDLYYSLHWDPKAAASAVHPSSFVQTLLPRVVEPDEVEAVVLGRFVDRAAGERDRRGLEDMLVEQVLAPDLTFERAGETLRSAYDPPFFATYVRGADLVGHGFLRFAQPEEFGNVAPQDVRRYGSVMDAYLDHLSEWVGRIVAARRPEEIVVVVSAFGLEPMPRWRRVLHVVTGSSNDSATHEWGPPGFVLAAGDGIAVGASVRRASILDIAPTLLYLMGVPVARDLEGRVLAEIVDEDFARSHPITYVPSYENLKPPER